MIAIPYLTALTTYFSYGLLFAFGQIRDFFRKFCDGWWSPNNLQVKQTAAAAAAFVFLIASLPFFFPVLLLIFLFDQGYAPICLGLEDFYIRRLYLRIQVYFDC